MLAAMFQGSFKESRTKEAVFPDLDPRAVREMVRYMYGGEVPEAALANDEQTIALMTAANHFCVQSLVDRCTRALRARFCVEKIAEFLKIADMMGCDAFKQVCLQYTVDHLPAV